LFERRSADGDVGLGVAGAALLYVDGGIGAEVVGGLSEGEAVLLSVEGDDRAGGFAGGDGGGVAEDDDGGLERRDLFSGRGGLRLLLGLLSRRRESEAEAKDRRGDESFHDCCFDYFR
jgi:hypothetical protein